MLPAVKGTIFIRKGKGLMASSKLRYFQILSTHGVLVKFQNEQQLTELFPRKLDFYNMNRKDQEKYKIEVI